LCARKGRCPRRQYRQGCQRQRYDHQDGGAFESDLQYMGLFHVSPPGRSNNFGCPPAGPADRAQGMGIKISGLLILLVKGCHQYLLLIIPFDSNSYRAVNAIQNMPTGSACYWNECPVDLSCKMVKKLLLSLQWLIIPLNFGFLKHFKTRF
jgi:hypothetical protein